MIQDINKLRSLLKYCDTPVAVWEFSELALPPKPELLDMDNLDTIREGPKRNNPVYLQQVQKNRTLAVKLFYRFYSVISHLIFSMGIWLSLVALLGPPLILSSTNNTPQLHDVVVIISSAVLLLLVYYCFVIAKKINKKICDEEDHAINKLWEKDHEIWRNYYLDQNTKLEREWNAKRAEIEERNKTFSSVYQELKENYLSHKIETICEYVSSVLEVNHNQLVFDDDEYFEDYPEVKYFPETKMIAINCPLPSPSEMPEIKEVRYVKTKNEHKAIPFSDKERGALYDSVIYQLCLSDINQIFLTDQINGIEAIVYNGWVNSLDKSTGNTANTCILSLQVSKERFQQINLKNVDPKECFRGLRGVGSAQLHGITPIPPIMRINTEDSRFIESYDVAHTLDEGTNLAAMDWQDFEHLIRETFSKIFGSDGMEVKVTQSSRDRGVDAIAFDPDPVRGGKIVIQAKRYTNVVGVSAVRDLYGTMMNEGAMKGILVTTSHFGNDAYDFVKGKPLTLISGGELLSLLAKQGHKANINIYEAKKLLAKES